MEKYEFKEKTISEETLNLEPKFTENEIKGFR